ncbi:hypothetical protein FA13DRAFT_31863 [Coprinellus micaceus]|uniref:Uncharacterized protein n=1 Tax=Coprinellus micaceus TaxID=71717 RepID=A0A4Y7U087_COPMI|nr:hypothetical protein FA13DRAFT_31863 [Coprinellus micaceus]
MYHTSRSGEGIELFPNPICIYVKISIHGQEGRSSRRKEGVIEWVGNLVVVNCGVATVTQRSWIPLA